MVTLVDVVAERSFAAAGRKRRLSRAVVGKHVQLLEDELGARFFHRTTRRLSLTDAGERFHQHCLKILAAVAEAEDDVGERAGRVRGRVRLTAPSAFAELHLMAPLEELTRVHPELELDLDCSERFVDFVREGFDVGLRICTSPPPGLVARKLAQSSVVVCASPGYLEEHGHPRAPEDLAHHDCLGWVVQSNASSWDLGPANQRRTVRIRPRHRTNDNRFLRHFALAGRGLAQLPAYFVAEELASGRLVSVLDRYRDRSRSLFIVYTSRKQLPPRVRVLVDHLSKRFAGRRW